MFAGDKTEAIMHQFYTKDRKECVRVEASLNGSHDSIIEVILSECSRNGKTSNPRILHGIPFSRV